MENGFEERRTALRAGVQQLSTEMPNRRKEQLAELKALRSEYYEVLSRYKDLKSLGETEKADELRPRLKELQAKMDATKSELDLMEKRESESIDEVIRRNPDTEIFKLAERTQNDGIEELKRKEALVRDLRHKAIHAREDYLALVEQVGAAYRDLFSIYIEIRRTEKLLPTGMHKAVRPAKAPNWSAFAVDDSEVSKKYGRTPFIYGL